MKSKYHIRKSKVIPLYDVLLIPHIILEKQLYDQLFLDLSLFFKKVQVDPKKGVKNQFFHLDHL